MPALPPAPVVRPATPADVPALVGSLARAFLDDPVMCWIQPDERRRAAGLRTFFSIQLRQVFVPHGEVWMAGPHGAAALWAPPGAPPPRWRDALRLAPMLPHLGRRVVRALRLLALVERHHPYDRPHWYLGVLGTDPPLQRRGLGSAVLAPVLERCDSEGVGAYLESSKEANLAFYRRHGFEVTGELRAPGGGPPLWLMWRDPRAG
jgi:ribosomal protein S18 acetylase RimI-like enzyme